GVRPFRARAADRGGVQHRGRTIQQSLDARSSACERIAGRPLTHRYSDDARIGDHIWWISSNAKFEAHYPGWRARYDINAILRAIFETNVERWREQESHR